MNIAIGRSIRFILTIQFILTTSILCQTIDNTIFNKTDNYLEEKIDSLEIVGANYAILQNGKLVHKNSFGLANIEHKIPMTLDKIFAVASISKMFSSIALHQLLNSQNRSVDETVSNFLPNRNDIPKSWKNLTLRQLLSHTSGIPDQIDYEIFLAPESEEFVIKAMSDKPFSSKPGEAAKYNATGFLLIRIIIEKLANQDFETFMIENYFNKLNLNSAVYGGFKKIVPNRVKSYRAINNYLEMFPLNYSPPMYAGAGLNINIIDLIKWFQALLNEEILSKKELLKIWTPVKLNNGDYGAFGLGWEAKILGYGYRMTGHGGAGISSFRHYWNEDSNESITVILLTNGAKNWGQGPNKLAFDIAYMILEES